MLVLGAALALAIGISLGLLGGGGSILTLPLLVYVLSVEPRAAIATSLLVVGVTSVVGLIPHARAGRVRWSTGVILGVSGMLGAAIGARVAHHLPPTMLLVGFAIVMVLTALKMLRGRGEAAARGEAAFATRALIGVGVGVVSGLFGAGGGFLIVPALVTFAGLGMREAIATSLLVIAMQALAGFATHASHVHLDVTLTATVAVATALGGLLGGRWSNRVNADALRRGFGYLVLTTGVAMIMKNLPSAVLHRPELPLVVIAALSIALAALLARRPQH